MIAWAAAFVWTLALELPVWAWAQRLPGVRPGRALLLALALNLVTHPALWLLCSLSSPGVAALWGLEALVVVVEARLLLRWARPAPTPARAWCAAVLANALSWGLGGLVIEHLAKGG